jgi:hypothetical protein
MCGQFETEPALGSDPFGARFRGGAKAQAARGNVCS